jgi:ketosteroid isomerase-like protein
MSQENVKIVQSVYEAFAHGDVGRGVEPLGPDFEWIPDDRNIMGAVPIRGQKGFRRFVEEAIEIFHDWEIQPEKFFECGDQVIVVFWMRTQGRSSGARLAAHNAHIWTFRRGVIVRGEEYAEPDKALAAVGLAE